jgi:hypothetical protein
MPLLSEFHEDVHMPKKINAAVKEWTLRMFAEHRQDCPTDTARAAAVAQQRRLDTGRSSG